MSVRREVAIECDNCGEIAGYSRNTRIARQEVHRMGWVRVAGADYCPRCATEANPIAAQEYYKAVMAVVVKAIPDIGKSK